MSTDEHAGSVVHLRPTVSSASCVGCSVMSGLFNPEAFEQMPGQMSMEQVRGDECGHPTTSHYAHRMVDFPREQGGHCGDHTRCEQCDPPLPVEPMPSTYRWAL